MVKKKKKNLNARKFSTVLYLLMVDAIGVISNALGSMYTNNEVYNNF